jgi:hypothetical protein
MDSSFFGHLATGIRHALCSGYLRSAGWMLLCLVLAGCGSPAKPVVAPVDNSRQNLQKIAISYFRAAQKLERPPKSVEELMPFLQEGLDPAAARDVLRSPNDNQDYVIVWGVDFFQLAKAGGNPSVVFAYERAGKGGKRYVLKAPSEVLVMTNAEFKQAPFPPGHQPSF